MQLCFLFLFQKANYETANNIKTAKVEGQCRAKFLSIDSFVFGEIFVELK